MDLCALYGYYAEEHVLQTRDGYLLGLHRLCWRKGEEGVRVNAGHGSVQKGVVYLHHGLMMNSEVWVCLTKEERCLPFMLVQKGYDVWVSFKFHRKLSIVVSDDYSWEITGETNILRSLLDSRQPRMIFGIFL